MPRKHEEYEARFHISYPFLSAKSPEDLGLGLIDLYVDAAIGRAFKIQPSTNKAWDEKARRFRGFNENSDSDFLAAQEVYGIHFFHKGERIFERHFLEDYDIDGRNGELDDYEPHTAEDYRRSDEFFEIINDIFVRWAQINHVPNPIKKTWRFVEAIQCMADEKMKEAAKRLHTAMKDSLMVDYSTIIAESNKHQTHLSQMGYDSKTTRKYGIRYKKLRFS